MKKRLFAVGIALLMLFQLAMPGVIAAPAEPEQTDTVDLPLPEAKALQKGPSSVKESSLSYKEYIEKNGGLSFGDGTQLVISKKMLALNESTALQAVPFTVTADGWYAISWDYRSLGNSSNDHQVRVGIDGACPFEDMALLTVPRMWLVGETSVLEDGSQVRGSSTADPDWYRYTAFDAKGLYSDPFMMYLTAGKHTLQLQWQDGDMQLRNVTLFAYEGLKTYKDYAAQYSAYTGKPLEDLQAEDFVRANSLSIIAAADLSSSQTVPYSYQKQLLNVLGGSNWEYTGQRVEWEVEVPSAGLYHVNIRFKQSYKTNLNVYRRLLVNGTVPFKEADAIAFPYENGWQTFSSDWAIYLEAGKNVLAMEVTPGENAELMEGINNAVQELNTLYRQVLMLTGSTPDTYRDYHLDVEIPGIRESLSGLAKRLQQLLDMATEMSGSASAFSVVRDTIWQLDDMAADLRSLTQSGRLSRFKSNISSMASLGQSLREQPLQIDAINLSSPDDPKPVLEESFWSQAKHTWLRFIASFSDDYNAVIGGSTGDSVVLWTALGRDQLQILKSMVSNEFVPASGVQVEVQLVTGSLIQAVLAGKGPDISLSAGETDVINYAMRGALTELSQFPEFKDVMKRFSASAASPFTYLDGVYAIPQTQSFDMLFVRTDILEELGLEIPRTWTDFTTKIFPVLQRDNLLVGVGNLNNGGALVSIFTTLLYQYGGSLYSDDLLSAALTTPQALEAFDFAVALYNEYGVPTAYDFLNRFRTGEMPIAIAPYGSYNTLQVGAPEIAGLWEMVPIPGVENEDGTVNNTQLMSSAGTIMLAGTKSKEACWEFMKWWSSADVQQSFGLQQEAILGPSGRYTPANLEAMAGLSWSSNQLKLLEEQRAVSTSLTHVPGSYYIGKSLNSALVTSVDDGTLIAREQLMYWADLINVEMTRKQKEFNYTGRKVTGEEGNT